MAPKKQTKTNRVAPALVYVGPNMGGDLPMTRFTVFRNGLPKPVKNRFEKDPVFASVFVPVDRLAAAKQELKDPASAVYKSVAAVAKARGDNLK